MKGRFIVLEGGEGAGKDVNIELLKHDFPGDGFVWVKDPGGTALGLTLREVLQHGENVARETELFLFLASRAQLVHEVIEPALKAGKHVISNRFDLSTLAYQVYARERFELTESLIAMSKIARKDAIPDLMILLDISPQAGLIRAAERHEKITRFEAEAIAFHERVRSGYLAHVGDYSRHVVIDASQPIEAVYAEVKAAVEQILA